MELSGVQRGSGSWPIQPPRGSAASYYPETNVLVPLDSVAGISNTPTSKGVVVVSNLCPRHPRGRGADGDQGPR